MKRMKKMLALALAVFSLAGLSGCGMQSQDPNHLLVAHGHGDWHPVHIGLTRMEGAPVNAENRRLFLAEQALYGTPGLRG